MNKMKKKTKILIGVILAALAVTGAFLAAYLVSVERYQNAVETMTYDNADASHVADGVYTGECDVGFIYAKVAVTVESGSIIQIDLLEHKNERGGSAEGIEQHIIAEQRVDVDAVAGATNSSKVIKKAVDNALSGAG